MKKAPKSLKRFKGVRKTSEAGVERAAAGLLLLTNRGGERQNKCVNGITERKLRACCKGETAYADYTGVRNHLRYGRSPGCHDVSP